MKLRQIVATSLQALGICGISGGVMLVSLWGGIVVLGAGLVAFGIAVERAN